MAGPLLNFLGCDPASGSWRGSVLLVTPPSSDKAVMAAQPTMTVLDEGASADCGAQKKIGNGAACAPALICTCVFTLLRRKIQPSRTLTARVPQAVRSAWRRTAWMSTRAGCFGASTCASAWALRSAACGTPFTPRASTLSAGAPEDCRKAVRVVVLHACVHVSAVPRRLPRALNNSLVSKV